ncbi:sodium stibogluconate resistance protein [Angomonas deanei]|nr:sodium stibogluconate resistance protein [Angomonas deanei]|eukprot:EPY15731.1 sodium stibogluconate resistance protein [Angomonas deanei]
MGGKSSSIKTEEHHPDLYYKGREAIQQGRYSNAELYFQQCLANHPGRVFWNELLDGVFKKDTGNKRGAEEEGEDVVFTNNEDFDDAVSKSTNPRKKKLLVLPSDREITPIVDYIRMCLDISHNYLSQPPDEKNGRIAMLYCGFVSIALQVLWAFLYSWLAKREEEAERHETASSRGEYPDEEGGGKKRAHSAGDKKKETTDEKKEKEIERDDEKNILVKFGFARSIDHPTEAEISNWLHVFISYIRYSWHSATTNFCVLVLLFSNELDATDIKRRKIVQQNIIDISKKVQYDLTALAKQFPEGMVARTVVKYMPPLDYELHDITEFEGEPSQGTGQKTSSQNKSSKSSAFYASFTSSALGKQTFLSACRDFSIITPILVEVNFAVDFEFDINFDIPKKSLTMVQTPAERDTFHYISWFTAKEVIIVPGHNSAFLMKAIPHYYTPPPKGPHSSLMIMDRPNAANMAKALLSPEAAANLNFITSYEDSQDTTANKIKSKDGVLHVNTRLDFHDTLTLRKLGLEEAFVGCVPLFVMNIKLLQRTGEAKRADEFITYIDKASEAFYGRNSEEHKYLNGMLQTYTF